LENNFITEEESKQQAIEFANWAVKHCMSFVSKGGERRWVISSPFITYSTAEIFELFVNKNEQ